jgi:hypothetical protein
MKPTLLLFTIALATNCAEERLERGSTRAADGVQVANREPGSDCRALDAVEVRSSRADAPTLEQLRVYAAERGANYVVIDRFSVYDERDEVLTRGRLFSCPAMPEMEATP